jgi:hypothetical protein
VILLDYLYASCQISPNGGLSQSKVNQIRTKHFENIVIPIGGRPQALIIRKKRYTMCLVIVGELYSTVVAIRELKSA